MGFAFLTETPTPFSSLIRTDSGMGKPTLFIGKQANARLYTDSPNGPFGLETHLLMPLIPNHKGAELSLVSHNTFYTIQFPTFLRAKG
jgi:hypothetical protein